MNTPEKYLAELALAHRNEVLASWTEGFMVGTVIFSILGVIVGVALGWPS